MLLMAVILICLVLINNAIQKNTLSPKEKIFLWLPFSIYLGWITVATIANFTVLLVKCGVERIWSIRRPQWGNPLSSRLELLIAAGREC